jgi:hypothetical protein
MDDEAEIQQRQRYWFENWADFTCEVVVSTPQTANARVGAILGDFFGALPIPMHTQEIDRGTFRITNGCVWVLGRYRTYCWPIQTTMCLWFDDGSGAEMRQAGQPVVTLRGPVAAPLAGAYASYGLLSGQ